MHRNWTLVFFLEFVFSDIKTDTVAIGKKMVQQNCWKPLIRFENENFIFFYKKIMNKYIFRTAFNMNE